MQRILGALLIVSAVAAGVFFLVERLAMQERAADRRAVEMRASDLAARFAAVGSPFACLDAVAGESVENSCERALFGRPETVAAAVTLTAARIDLLADAADIARRSNTSFDRTLAGARRATEIDRFGLAAHVLATRDGCTADKCAAFGLVSDASALKSNMRARLYSQYIDRHNAAWSEREVPLASAPPAEVQPQQPAAAPVATLAPPARPAPSGKYDFPSAASIPPVSIMNPEPKTPVAAPAPAENPR